MQLMDGLRGGVMPTHLKVGGFWLTRWCSHISRPLCYVVSYFMLGAGWDIGFFLVFHFVEDMQVGCLIDNLVYFFQ